MYPYKIICDISLLTIKDYKYISIVLNMLSNNISLRKSCMLFDEKSYSKVSRWVKGRLLYISPSLRKASIECFNKNMKNFKQMYNYKENKKEKWRSIEKSQFCLDVIEKYFQTNPDVSFISFCMSNGYTIQQYWCILRWYRIYLKSISESKYEKMKRRITRKQGKECKENEKAGYKSGVC